MGDPRSAYVIPWNFCRPPVNKKAREGDRDKVGRSGRQPFSNSSCLECSTSFGLTRDERRDTCTILVLCTASKKKYFVVKWRRDELIRHRWWMVKFNSLEVGNRSYFHRSFCRSKIIGNNL